MKYQAQISEKTFNISFQKKENAFEVDIDGVKLPAILNQIEGTNTYVFFLNNHLFEVEIEKNETGYLVHHKGKSYRCDVEDERLAKLKNSIKQKSALQLENEIKSPMPGLVVAIEVEVGQQVKAGQGLIIIEAMKMENEIKASTDAIVKEIKVKPKQPVEMNQTLLILE